MESMPTQKTHIADAELQKLSIDARIDKFELFVSELTKAVQDFVKACSSGNEFGQDKVLSTLAELHNLIPGEQTRTFLSQLSGGTIESDEIESDEMVAFKAIIKATAEENIEIDQHQLVNISLKDFEALSPERQNQVVYAYMALQSAMSDWEQLRVEQKSNLDQQNSLNTAINRFKQRNQASGAQGARGGANFNQPPIRSPRGGDSAIMRNVNIDGDIRIENVIQGSHKNDGEGTIELAGLQLKGDTIDGITLNRVKSGGVIITELTKDITIVGLDPEISGVYITAQGKHSIRVPKGSNFQQSNASKESGLKIVYADDTD